MRKLSILLLVLVLVVGISVVGFSKDIPINLKVGPFGRVIVPEGASFDLELTDLTGDKKFVRGIQVQSNAGFKMTIDNNFDPSNFEDIFASDMWDAYEEGDYVFSPNVFLKNYPSEFGLASNGIDGQWDNVGSHDGTLVVNEEFYVPGGSYTFDMGYDFGVNPESNWYDLPANDYGQVGTVTVTISSFE